MNANPSANPRLGGATRTLLLVLMLGLLYLLAVVVLMIPERPLYLADDSRLSVVDERVIAESGVGNPVTAVLLNFRAYDTLLELAVLVLAVIGVQAAGAVVVPRNSKNGWQDNRLLQAALAIIVPVSIVVAGDLLWMGADHPGGAFQAGAVLSGAGIMLILAGRLNHSFLNDWRYRVANIAGVAVFVMVGLLVMTVGEKFLEYPGGYAKALILAIETAAMGSVAVVFVFLFDAVAGPLASARQEDRQ